MAEPFFNRITQFFRESSAYNKFFFKQEKSARKLVFYSESAIYWQYFEGYIQHVLDHSDLQIAYITSDQNDPVFRMENPRIKPWYFKEFLPKVFENLDSDAVVMTMPELGICPVGRSKHAGVDHVYAFHAIGSTHLQYPPGAFDNYDTILCVGPHHTEEIRKTESMKGLPAKRLIEAGYYRLEKIHRDFHAKTRAPHARPKVLIAPSWNKDNILEHCIDDLVRALQGEAMDVVIRPHPEFIKRNPTRVDEIRKLVAQTPNVQLETNMVSGASVLESDVLMTDWSGIAFEYAFGTDRPVLFVNTPCRIDNPHYRELGIEPFELACRGGKIGREIDQGGIASVANVIEDLIRNRSEYRAEIERQRRHYLYAWMNSSAVGGDYLINRCKGTA